MSQRLITSELSAYPQRIVCLTEESTETLYLLGEDEQEGIVRAKPGERSLNPRECESSVELAGRPNGGLGSGAAALAAEDAAVFQREDGGGTTGPMSPSGASSRSTITGA